MCHFRGSSKRDTKRPSQGLSPEVSCASGEKGHSSQREQLKRSLRGREVPGNSEAAWHIGVLWTETGGADLGQNKGTGAPARESSRSVRPEFEPQLHDLALCVLGASC